MRTCQVWLKISTPTDFAAVCIPAAVHEDVSKRRRYVRRIPHGQNVSTVNRKVLPRDRSAAAPQATAEAPNLKRSQTIYRPLNQPASDPGQTAPLVAKDRKIVGIVVTYSWSPEGRIYPIREGRNFICRDKGCEICIPEDQTLSGKNSHITYRQTFVVGDMVSMTGTDVNGVPIEEQFRSLDNYATIRSGSTYFTFIAVEPGQTTK